MKREFLESLGLDKDVIDKIMGENGKDIEAEKAKTTAAITERDTLQTQLDDANKEIKGYKDMDIDAVKQAAADWEQKAKDNADELARVRNEAALDKALTGTTTVDADLLKKALDHDTITYKDGNVIGLDEQIKQLQKDKPYLFKPAEDPAGGGGNKGGFEPYKPKSSAGDPSVGGGAKTLQDAIGAALSKSIDN